MTSDSGFIVGGAHSDLSSIVTLRSALRVKGTSAPSRASPPSSPSSSPSGRATVSDAAVPASSSKPAGPTTTWKRSSPTGSRVVRLTSVLSTSAPGGIVRVYRVPSDAVSSSDPPAASTVALWVAATKGVASGGSVSVSSEQAGAAASSATPAAKESRRSAATSGRVLMRGA